MSLFCNKGSMLLVYCHTSFILLSVLLATSKNGTLVGMQQKNLHRKCSNEGKIKTLLYLRVGEFRGTFSAADERETQIDGGTIFHSTTAAFFHPFRVDSTRFLSSSAPSLSHGIGCCICGSILCEIMERACAVINVFENLSSSDWF